MTVPGVVDTFLDLVQIPSVSGRERRVADAVIARLRELGVCATEDDAANVIGGDAGNIYAWIPPTVSGSPVLLCAHLDTVDPGPCVRPAVTDGAITAAEGRVLGADDKAAVAAILDAVRRTVEGGGVAHAGIELLFTVQEECGLAGARSAALGSLRARRAFLVDYSGPIGGVIMSAPSYVQATFVVHGRSAHASQPASGNNAILAAAAALCSLPPTPEGVTANVGFIRGGSGLNVVPDRAEIEIEVRGIRHALAQSYLDAAIENAQRAVDQVGARFEAQCHVLYHAYAHVRSDPSVSLAYDALGAIGVEPRDITVFGGSDANALIAAGVDAVTLTGGMVDIHTPQERIAIADLVTLSDLFVAAIQQTVVVPRD